MSGVHSLGQSACGLLNFFLACRLGAVVRPIGVCLGGMLWALCWTAGAWAEPPIDYATQVRPILAQHCYQCHGPDAATRQADLRLDQVLSHREVIEPGDLKASELYRRLVASDPEVRMPPPESGSRPGLSEIAILRSWIEQGAPAEEHWAFRPIRRPPSPKVDGQRWGNGPIDAHVLARLRRRQLDPAPPADAATWLRRVTFDLTGLPPTEEEVRALVASDTPQARAQVVDRLLASPAYGEQMARSWLDLARYADTHGYNIDSHREMWRYREWVIEAFNDNLPFDRFSIEQLAGDLLPDATTEEVTATGFLRSHAVNDEMGAIAEEYQHAYVVDRVNTIGTTWLGLTLSCAQCHDHKFDPVSQEDYYGLAAMLDNFAERGLDGRRGNAVPVLRSPTFSQRQELETMEARLAEIESQMAALKAEAAPQLAEWIADRRGSVTTAALPTESLWIEAPLDGPGEGVTNKAGLQGQLKLSAKNPLFVPGRQGQSLLVDGRTYLHLEELPPPETGGELSFSAWLFPTTHDAGFLVVQSAGDQIQLEVVLQDRRLWAQYRTAAGTRFLLVSEEELIKLHQWQHLAVVFRPADSAAVTVYKDGNPLALTESSEVPGLLHDDQLQPRPHPGRGTFIAGLPEDAGLRGMLDEVRFYTQALGPEQIAVLGGSNPLRSLLEIAPEDRTEAQTERLLTAMLEETAPPFAELQSERQTQERRIDRLKLEFPETMVVAERAEPRTTHLRIGGQYDRLGPAVSPSAPTHLFAQDFGRPQNRLELAQWLVDPQNPLTARVVANRIWAHHFGTGLVETVDDFGIRGEIPRHRELLDWLAAELIESGWDLKQLHRLIVTSAVYGQSSAVGREAYLQDPENRELARGPRLRRTAEEIRDAALAASGLLVRRQGGRSVRPYQPRGLWEEIAYGGDYTAQSYVQDQGPQLYRRGLYTYWKRSSPPPTLAIFDAPNRETCVAERGRSNTPQQALALLGDPTFVEAARSLAASLVREFPDDVSRQIEAAHFRVTSQQVSPEDRQLLLQLYQRQREVFAADPDRAEAWLSVGETAAPRGEMSAEIGALAFVCHTLLNLDQAITTD